MFKRLWRHANHITVRWVGIALLAVLMLSLFAWGMAANRSALRELSDQEITLNQALYTRNQQRARLEAAVQQVGTKSYVEREARSSLGYLKSVAVGTDTLYPPCDVGDGIKDHLFLNDVVGLVHLRNA